MPVIPAAKVTVSPMLNDDTSSDELDCVFDSEEVDIVCEDDDDPCKCGYSVSSVDDDEERLLCDPELLDELLLDSDVSDDDDLELLDELLELFVDVLELVLLLLFELLELFVVLDELLLFVVELDDEELELLLDTDVLDDELVVELLDDVLESSELDDTD